MYFANPWVSNSFGAGYSFIQGKSNETIISNYAIGVMSGKIGSGIKGAKLYNPYLQHSIGGFTAPLLINSGNNGLNPYKE